MIHILQLENKDKTVDNSFEKKYFLLLYDFYIESRLNNF